MKYELVALQHAGAERHGVRPSVSSDSQPLGIFLVEMLSDRRIRVEVFAGKTVAEVSGFTLAAKIYER